MCLLHSQSWPQFARNEKLFKVNSFSRAHENELGIKASQSVSLPASQPKDGKQGKRDDELFKNANIINEEDNAVRNFEEKPSSKKFRYKVLPDNPEFPNTLDLRKKK